MGSMRQKQYFESINPLIDATIPDDFISQNKGPNLGTTAIQDILKNPEITVGIFSHTRPIAKAFLDQIKNELQDNILLKEFQDIVDKRTQ